MLHPPRGHRTFRDARHLRTLLLPALLAAGCLFGLSGDISGRDARRLVESGATLLDVRTAAEFEAVHLEGARNIPVQELDRRMGELGSRDRPVLVYCRSGHRSARAAAMLREAGFVQVRDLGARSRWPD